ncbi:hypothetical protein DFQ27_002562 [Actinomortierella ambigua]|uniref:Uncharacterized protein n=1 Tax=Actinomortierella ambigua TaxID=1343610 RepID=A0A9P6QB41_9FUNG|nr:hypothetical protein DFQ27_002562 [Actinomortierella ambigua]
MLSKMHATRPEATRELTPALQDLEEYLRHHVLSTISSRTASENASTYPHLGELLTLCARHPIILASRSRGELVLTAVIAYANQQEHYQDVHPRLPAKDSSSIDDGDGILSPTPFGYATTTTTMSSLSAQKVKAPLPPEAMWCAQRIKDVMQIKHCQRSTVPTTLEVASAVEKHLQPFSVDRRTYEENTADEIISTVTTALTVLQDQLNLLDLETMAKWTMDLSSLCAPIATDESMVALSLRLLCVAQQIQSQNQRRGQDQGRVAHLQTLSKPFVEEVAWSFDRFKGRLQEDQWAPLLLFMWDHYKGTFDIGLLSLMDRIMELAYANQQPMAVPSADMDQRSIRSIMKHIRSSMWLATIRANPYRTITTAGNRSAGPTSHQQHECVFGLLLQGLAKTASQMPDWRIARICVLVLQFCLDAFVVATPPLLAPPPIPTADSVTTGGKNSMAMDIDHDEDGAVALSVNLEGTNTTNATDITITTTTSMRPFLEAVRSCRNLLTTSSANQPLSMPFPEDVTTPGHADTILSPSCPQEVEELSRVAQAWIYGGGGPSTIAERQHAVFLVMTALAQQDHHWLGRLVDYFESIQEDVALRKSIAGWMHWMTFSAPVAEEEDEKKKKKKDEAPGSTTTTMGTGRRHGLDGGNETVASSGDILNLLLQATRDNVRSDQQENGQPQDPDRDDGTLAGLQAVLSHYQAVLTLNPVVLADYVFAVCLATKDGVSAQKLLQLAPAASSNSPTSTRWLDILSTQGTSRDEGMVPGRILISPQQADEVKRELCTQLKQ